MAIWSKLGIDKHNHLLQEFLCFLGQQSQGKPCEMPSKPRLIPIVNGMTVCNNYQWLTGLLHGTYWCIWVKVKDKVIYTMLRLNEGNLKEQGSIVNPFGELKHIFEENALPQWQTKA